MSNRVSSTISRAYIDRATVAASMLKRLSEASPLPYLKVVAGVSLLIMETVQNVKSNQDQLPDVDRTIDQLLCVIVEVSLETSENNSPSLLQSMAKFADISVVGNLADWRAIEERKHHQLLSIFAVKDGSATASILSKDFNGRQSDIQSAKQLQYPFAAAARIPQIFHGRESELNDVVANLLQDEGRASALGLEFTGKLTAKLSQSIFKCLSSKKSCLLVLDNFETPWEPRETRAKVEEFLSLLGDLRKVALLGPERPLKIRWTRPFVQPLRPLPATAARQTFMDIADPDLDGSNDRFITELLVLSGNLQLVVTLMANIASFEGCESVLSRWKRESIAILSEGSDKESNLETSLHVSLQSADGVVARRAAAFGLTLAFTDVRVRFRISLAAKPLLLRTSLAYMDGNRLKVLVPVREFIKKAYPPTPETVGLRVMPSGDLIQRLAANTGNITSVLRYGLENVNPDSSDLKDIVYGIFYFNSFLTGTSGTFTPLMADIAQLVDRVDDDQLRGYYIWSRFNGEGVNIQKADVPRLVEEGKKYFRLAADLPGEAKLNEAVGIHYFRIGDPDTAFKYCEAALELANKAGDNGRRHGAAWLLAAIKNTKGEFRDALVLARIAHSAAMMGAFHRETQGMQEEARAWIGLGNFAYGIALCERARQLVTAAGLTGSAFELTLLDFEAEICAKKTEYRASRALNENYRALN
ncbi:hypothetical protein B0H14DRAFT_3857382 [Mycena olivaceomarginata]|nr:hypothetical protein B0H14DRAFT_3857382 [Mycena olivaceomarginata]